MKLIYLAIVLLLINGCSYINNDIELTGTVQGISSGTVIIKDDDGKTVLGASIVAGKFQIRKQRLMHPGYYLMDVNDYAKKDNQQTYELYLEQGTYTLAIKPKQYPAITSSAKIQNELSAYYHISDSVNRLNHTMHHEEDSLLAVLNGREGAKLSKPDFQALAAKIRALQDKKFKGISDAAKVAILVNKYPQNEVAIHIINAQNYTDDPQPYYAVYQQLPSAQKNTREGRQLDSALTHLVKLVPGAPAPAIYGNLPDGKAFDIKQLHQRVIVIDFWRSGDAMARDNHSNLALLRNTNVALVSVSFDLHRDHWLNAIKQDKMNWPQVSDLKGDDSPNAATWAITDLPTYYVIGDGKIVEGEVHFERVAFVVENYLATHH